MTGLIERLQALSTAEDFFTTLDVACDEAVVRVARLHILKRMGAYLRETDLSQLTEGETLSACRDALTRAYADFVASSPIAERVFKVHRDAALPKAKPARPFVPLSALAGSA